MSWLMEKIDIVFVPMKYQIERRQIVRVFVIDIMIARDNVHRDFISNELIEESSSIRFLSFDVDKLPMLSVITEM